MRVWVDGEIIQGKTTGTVESKHSAIRKTDSVGNQGNHPGCKTGHRCCQVLSNKSHYWLSQSDVIAILVLVQWRTPGDLGRPVYSAVFFFFSSIKNKQKNTKNRKSQSTAKVPMSKVPNSKCSDKALLWACNSSAGVGCLCLYADRTDVIFSFYKTRQDTTEWIQLWKQRVQRKTDSGKDWNLFICFVTGKVHS